jgi:hypothetical protein
LSIIDWRFGRDSVAFLCDSGKQERERRAVAVFGGSNPDRVGRHAAILSETPHSQRIFVNTGPSDELIPLRFPAMAALVPDPRVELAEIARRTRSHVRRQNLLHPSATEPFDQVCRFARDGHSVSWATNGSMFLIGVSASSSIVFAAGTPDQILGASKPVQPTEAVVFRSDTHSPSAWLSENGHSSLVIALGLGSNEQLVVARNSATLMVEADWLRFSDLLALVAALPPDRPPVGEGEVIDGLRFDAAEVTPELRQLLPMLRRWATGDDTARSNRIASATDEDLRELVEVVSPELQAIDAFIDSIGEPLPDEAALLGSLAEAALEAKHELERKPRS